jgi:tripartite-type tricarboxylate transporter receptor subunit TctC
MLDRRRFISASGLLALGASLPGFVAGRPAWAASQVQGNGPRLLFGYPSGSIGSELAVGCLAILATHSDAMFRLECIDGRNSRMATEQARHGPVDGSMMLQTQSTSMVMLPSIYSNLGYDPLKDFVPVTTLGELSYSLTVGPLVPTNVTRVEHYLDWLQSNPDLRDVGYSMHGSQGHLAMLMLARAKSIALSGRPYKGSLMLLKDLCAGSLAAAFTPAGNGNADLWNSGQLRSIGITRRERVAYWPTVPTLAEQGLPEIDLNAWYSWLAPAAIVPAELAQLRAKSQAMKDTAEYAALLARLRITAINLDPAQYLQRTRDELQRYAALVRSLDIKPLD